ncbi:unnamed protein product [Amoebophrya sp. A25]|nr:unnamed protein product [Amoebophrya sp. A25]|eukprot:GSA25T00003557001.1
MSASSSDVIERFHQKRQIFKKLREFRTSLHSAGLLSTNRGAKCTVLEVESMWISLFGTTALSTDFVQFIHAIDTSRGWPKGASLKDKALIFKLIAARNGECSFHTLLESPLCFVPYVPNTLVPKTALVETTDLNAVMADLSRSVVYRKVDLLRLDMFSSGYVSAEEIQILTPRLYPLHTIKAALLEILTRFCEKQNFVLSQTTLDLSFHQKGVGLTRALPAEGPWFLRFVIKACEMWDRREVYRMYLKDPAFQEVYKQVTPGVGGAPQPQVTLGFPPETSSSSGGPKSSTEPSPATTSGGFSSQDIRDMDTLLGGIHSGGQGEGASNMLFFGEQESIAGGGIAGGGVLEDHDLLRYVGIEKFLDGGDDDCIDVETELEEQDAVSSHHGSSLDTSFAGKPTRASNRGPVGLGGNTGNTASKRSSTSSSTSAPGGYRYPPTMPWGSSRHGNGFHSSSASHVANTSSLGVHPALASTDAEEAQFQTPGPRLQQYQNPYYGVLASGGPPGGRGPPGAVPRNGKTPPPFQLLRTTGADLNNTGQLGLGNVVDLNFLRDSLSR